jgi:transposase-like protein
MSTEEKENLKEKALRQFKNGVPLFGKDGAFAPMLKEFLEEALEAEMEGHLSSDESGREVGNKRNGKGRKTVKSSHGEVEIENPQDRHSVSLRPTTYLKRVIFQPILV